MDLAGPRRASLVRSIGEVVAEVTPGSTIGIGGIVNSNHPMAVIRELIRRGIGDLHVVGTCSGIELDLLIAAGLVRRISTPTVSVETIQAIAPAFRWAAQSGRIEVAEHDEGMLYAALQAAAQRVPFAPWPAGLGTSFPDVNDGLVELESPFGGAPVLAIRALPIDVVFLHAARSDSFGNVQMNGGGHGDRALARAARRVFCSVERVIGNHEIRLAPHLTAIPGADGIVHAPFGAHPFSSPGLYVNDVEHERAYLTAANRLLKGDEQPVAEYLEEWVHAVPTHFDYLGKVGLERLYGLEEGRRVDSGNEAGDQ